MSRTVLVVAILAAVMTPVAADPGMTDAEYAGLLVGTWSGEYLSENDRRWSYGEKTYHADGTASGFTSTRVLTAGGYYVESGRSTYFSRWRIENGVVVIWDVNWDPPTDFESDLEIRDRIVSVDDTTAEFEALADGSTFERRRVIGRP